MPSNHSDFQNKVRALAALKRGDKVAECYGMSNPAKFVTGGFLCGIPNLENVDGSAEALCVFSKIQLSPHSELHTAILIRKNLSALLDRMNTMASTPGDFFADKNNNCALFLWSDGNIYAYNKAKEIELNPEILKKLGHGIEPDALYWAVYGNDTDAKGGAVAQLEALVGNERFTRIQGSVAATAANQSSGLASAFMDVCKFCSDYEASSVPWMRDDPRVRVAQTALSKIKDWLKRNFGSYGGSNFTVEASEGAGNFPRVPWVCLLPPGQAASDGVFVSICFGREGKGAVAGFAESVRNRRGLKFVKRTALNPLLINVNGASPGTFYNDSFENPLEFYPEDFSEENFKTHIAESLDRCIAFLIPKAVEPFGPEHRRLFRTGLESENVRFTAADNIPEYLIAALAAKPFVILTGNSGTGKTKLAELFANWLCGSSKSQGVLVPIGADWTDNRNVLGFVNHLRLVQVNEGEEGAELPLYQSTKILDLLLEAALEGNAHMPFFLILDEMNLSHVERYFADFLSTMESKDGGLMLHREGGSLPRRPDGTCDVPETLQLPRNVFIIGTVNVDETTYMFSPKVLDRANVLEFRVGEGVPKAFLGSGGQGVGEIAPAPDGYAEAFLELSYRARGIKGSPLALVADPLNPPADARKALEGCRNTITDLFALMARRHQEFAFRPMAEILRFLAVDYELTAERAKWDSQAAMDAQILQKILPKLHGSKRKIGSLLTALAKYCEQGNLAAAEALLIDEPKAETYPAAEDKREKKPRFEESHRKLCEMIEAVRRDQFVSFIQ